MNKTQTILLAVLLATGFLVSTSASALGFTGYYDPSDASSHVNWTLTETRAGNDPPSSGGVNTAGAPTSITIIGQDDGGGDSDGSCPPDNFGGTICDGLTEFTIPTEILGDVSFHYEYTTNDFFGNPASDQFGYVLDGILFVLVDEIADPRSGDVTLRMLPAGTVIGWWHSTMNNRFGEAFTVISNFSAPENPGTTPVPGTLALLGVGLMAPALRRRRR